MRKARMHSVLSAAVPTAVAPTSMVWLPGAYHDSRNFVDAGFPQAVRTRRLALDLWLVDLQLQHLGDRSVLEQLRSDFVLPARAAGCAVWLGGISLGGFIALDYAASYPGELDGLCLLAPYLGNRMLTAEIAGAPGVAAWQPGELAQIDEERRIWRYIKSRDADALPLYLGFGRMIAFRRRMSCWPQCCPTTGWRRSRAATSGAPGRRCGRFFWTRALYEPTTHCQARRARRARRRRFRRAALAPCAAAVPVRRGASGRGGRNPGAAAGMAMGIGRRGCQSRGTGSGRPLATQSIAGTELDSTASAERRTGRRRHHHR